MSVARKKIMFTYDDLQYWEDDHLRHEIIEGEHYMSPSPITKHQRIAGKLFRRLSDYIEKKRLGEIFIAPYDVVFHENDVCVPDLLYISNENQHIIGEYNIQGAPDLIIEILSPGTEKLDKGLKYKRYAYYGVKEYWIVDPKTQLIEVHDLEKQELLQVFPQNQTLNTPTFPDIHLKLSEIFE